MNIDDLFETDFTVNQINGNDLRKRKERSEVHVYLLSIYRLYILSDEKISPDASTMLTRESERNEKNISIDIHKFSCSLYAQLRLT